MKRGRYIFSLIAVLLLIVLFSSVLAVDDLLSLQGNIKQAGIDLALGNLTISVYDAQTAGNLIYNSSNEFNGAIVAGKYDVMLGNSSSNNLSLEYGKLYYLEIFVNNEKFSFNNSGGRQIFQSSTGQINGTYVNPRQINQTHFVYSVDLSNATGFNASFLTGQVSISQLTLGSNIVLNNQSVSFSDDQNITLGNRGWFKGLFNWLIAGNSSQYLSFNGTTLVFDEAKLNATIDNRAGATPNIFNQNLNTTSNVRFNNLSIAGNITAGEEIYINGVAVKQWLYNQTLNLYYYNQTASPYFYNMTISSGTSNIFNQNLNTTNNVLFSDLNVTNVLRVGNTVLQADTSGTLNVTGVANFNGGWRSSGVTISGGNVFAQTLFVYNITSLAVNDLEINGSLIPDLNNTFDVGNITQVYKNIYLSGDQGNIYFGSNSVKQWLYNASQTIYYYNQTATQYFYNQTPSIYYYNQSQTIYYYNQSQGFNYSLQNYNATFRNITADFYFGNGSKLTDVVKYNQTSSPFFYNMTMNSFVNLTVSGNLSVGTNTIFINPNLGKVGINTIIPSNTLTVNGTFNVTGGYDTTIGLIVNGSGAVGIGTASPTRTLDVKGSVHLNPNESTNDYGVLINGSVFRGGGAAAQAVSALKISTSLMPENGASPGRGIYGLYVNIENMTGISGAANNNFSDIAITPAPLFKPAGATVANHIGLFIDSAVAGGINNYAIYTTGTTDKSYFGGNVGIGAVIPSNALSVVGTGNITGGSATTWGLLVDSTGKVGIGTPIPSNNLTVVGSFNATGGNATTLGLLVDASGNVSIGLGSVTPNQKFTVGGNITAGNTGNVSATYFFGDGSKLTNVAIPKIPFQYTATSIYNDTSTVKVGIGVIIPSNKLTVNGTFNVTGGYDTTVGLIVNGSGAVGIGTTIPQDKLTVASGNINVSTNWANVTLGNGRIYWDSTSSQLVIKVT